MIKSMVSPQESDRPTLNKLNKVIADNFKPSWGEDVSLKSLLFTKNQKTYTMLEEKKIL